MAYSTKVRAKYAIKNYHLPAEVVEVLKRLAAGEMVASQLWPVSAREFLLSAARVLTVERTRRVAERRAPPDKANQETETA